MPLDLDFVRTQFPALHGDWVFMDNAGGSQTLQGVVERISEFLLTSNVQLGASYQVSQLAGQRVQAGRAALATLLHARPEEVILGPSSSVLFSFLAQAMAQQFQAGDEIIVTDVDHEANITPWLRLAATRGAVVRWWRVEPESLELRLEDLDGLLNERTRLVCVTHTSNLLGTINPIATIAHKAHAVDARLCVDGVAYAPHRAIDVTELEADFYIFSAYKVYGPHHAVLYGRWEELQRLGNLYHDFMADKLPQRLEPGNVNYELTYGCLAIIDYLQTLAKASGESDASPVKAAFAAIADHEERLSAELLDYLRGKNQVRIIGRSEADQDSRVATVSFVAGQRNSAAIVSAVDQHKIGIRYGDFYARRLVQALGLEAQNGVIRVSMVHYNTREEVQRLIQVLDTVL